MPSEKVTVETAAVNLKQQLESTGLLPRSTKPGCVLSYLALLRFPLQAGLATLTETLAFNHSAPVTPLYERQLHGRFDGICDKRSKEYIDMPTQNTFIAASAVCIVPCFMNGFLYSNVE